MYRWPILTLALLLLPAAGHADRLTMPKTLGAWKLLSGPQLIRGRKLFDYMNGAAEVHRMYGFRSMLLWRYHDGATTIKVELFDLGAAQGAFGDFTHARDLEGQTARLGQDGHFQSGVLWFWKGRHLACLAARGKKSGDAARPALERVGRILANKLRSATRPSLPSRLPRQGLRQRTIRYFKSAAALSYHYSDFTHGNKLALDGRAEAVMADYKTSAGASVLLLLSYPTARRCATIRGRFSRQPVTRRTDGKWFGIQRNGRHLRLVLEAPSEKEARRLSRNQALPHASRDR